MALRASRQGQGREHGAAGLHSAAGHPRHRGQGRAGSTQPRGGSETAKVSATDAAYLVPEQVRALGRAGPRMPVVTLL